MSTVVVDDQKDSNGEGELVFSEDDSPILPKLPGGGRDCADIAAHVLAPGRGVPRSWPWYRALVGAVGTVIKRLVLTLAGIVVGTLGCVVDGLHGLIRGASLRERLRGLLIVAVSPVFGAYLGARFAYAGAGLILPLIAGILHRFAPIVTLGKKVSHNLFGLTFVTRHTDVKTVFDQGSIFRVDIYNERMVATSGAFFLGMDPGPDYKAEQQLGEKAVGRDLTRCRKWVRCISCALVARALMRPSRTIDVVSELAHVAVIGNLKVFFGVDDTPDQRLRGWIQTLGYYIFNFWMGGPYRVAAAKAGADLNRHLRELACARAETPAGQGAGDVLDRMLLELGHSRPGPLPADKQALLSRTLGGLMSGATVPVLGLFVEVVNKLLDLRGAQREELRAASRSHTDATVWRYIQEAARFTTYPPLLYRHTFTPYVFCVDGKSTKTIERGSLVVAAPLLANFDASVFKQPARFNPARPYAIDAVSPTQLNPTRSDAKDTASPIIFGWGQHRCLGKYMGMLLLTEMVKAIFSRDVCRVSGPDGQVTKGTAGVIPDADFAQRLVVRFR